MATTTGTVACVQISENVGATRINVAGGGSEIFFMWFLPGGGTGIPVVLNSFTRVLHSMWVSLLREAQTNNSTVTIVHPATSAEILTVRLG